MDRSNNKNDQGKCGRIQTKTDTRIERHTKLLYKTKKVAMEPKSGSYTPDGITEIRL